jgi:hypothetical protein
MLRPYDVIAINAINGTGVASMPSMKSTHLHNAIVVLVRLNLRRLHVLSCRRNITLSLAAARAVCYDRGIPEGLSSHQSSTWLSPSSASPGGRK